MWKQVMTPEILKGLRKHVQQQKSKKRKEDRDFAKGKIGPPRENRAMVSMETKMNKEKIASELIKIARSLAGMPMLLLPTNKSQRIPIADKLRMRLGIRGRQRPVFSRYITYIDPERDHNRFHYFAIYKDEETGEYVGGNTWGRIGYELTGKAMELARSERIDDVKDVVNAKIRTKLSKGYEIDSYEKKR